MKMRFTMIAALVGVAIPSTALAQQAEPEIDPVLLAQLQCSLGGECGALEAEPVAAVDMSPVVDGGQLVVATRGGGKIKPSPFPSFIDLQKEKNRAKVAPSERPSALKVIERRKTPLERTVGPAGLGAKRDAVKPSDAVAGRANLFVTFRLGSAEIEPSAIKSIDTLAKFMKDSAVSGKGKRLRIAGHTDASGDETFNSQLSADRAAAVRQALLERGIPADMLEAQGFGSAQPIDGYASTHGINRRVEAVVIQ